MDDLISILLPYYNAAFSLEGCLGSIIRQSWPSFEVVAVNDGSSDDGPVILSRYAESDPRIKGFSFNRNKGIVAALNAGLEQCRGDWIARMDADDRMRPDRLRLQLEYMKSYPDVDILGTRIRLFRFQGAPSPGQIAYQDWSNSLISHSEICSNIFAESPIMHPTFFLRKKTYDSLGGYRNRSWPEDYDFLLRAFQENARFAKLPDVLLDKGDHPRRLARIDQRCKRSPMFQAKAHYFKKKASLWQRLEHLMIIGTGSSGKMAWQALDKEGVKIDGFVDHLPASSARHFCGIPVYCLQQENASSFFEQHKGTLFLVCIGLKAGREATENLLQHHGFLPGEGYFRFI